MKANIKTYLYKKLHILLAVVCLMAAVFAVQMPVKAADGDAVYTVSLNRYFLDPETGLSGWGTSENEAIGQGMVESAVSGTGLLEVVDGHYYLTVRIVLAASVANVSFGVRSAGESEYAGVNAYLTQDNTASNNSIDYCFEIPDTNCTAAGFMYVEKMGTDVVFFVTLGGVSEGSGDFNPTFYNEAIASEQQAQAETPDTSTEAPQVTADTNDEPTEVTTAPTEAPKATETPKATVAPTTKAESKEESKEESKDKSKTESKEESKADSKENAKVESTSSSSAEKEAVNSANTGDNTGMIVGIVVAVIAVVAIVCVVLKKRKGKQ